MAQATQPVTRPSTSGPTPQMFSKPGAFILGANYWTSHAGTHMWRDWKPERIERDFQLLADAGLHVLRVFPLWTDFQPIHRMYGVANKREEYRFEGDIPLPDTEAGRAGMSEVMLDRFEYLVDLADKYNFKLIVGLITGWMSGRMYMPPALEGKNALKDPEVVKWEVRFIDHFVKRFRDRDAIVGWNPGNECNCMDRIYDRDEAWTWTATIAKTIKAADPTRPVISGLHGLVLEGGYPWFIHDQAELMDVLTSHPYPAFTPYCKLDPIDTIRTILQATVQSCYYRDIGGKPCFVEETGSLGPTFGSDEASAAFLRTDLFSLYAHDCQGALWWSNHEEAALEHPPYDWVAMERELGLFRLDDSPRPVADEMKKFGKMLESLPFEYLPERLTDAVCLLTRDQDHWGAGYSAFILAKQAGIDITFRSFDQSLPKADFYMLPSVTGNHVMNRSKWVDLARRVREDGATLYISWNGGYLTEFEEVTGLHIYARSDRRGSSEVTFQGDKKFKLTLEGSTNLDMKAAGAEVLASEANGTPAFTRYQYGKGVVYFLSLPLELNLTKAPGLFHEASAQPYSQVYEQMFNNHAPVAERRAVRKSTKNVGVTEHPFEDGSRAIIVINYCPGDADESLTLADGWKFDSVLHGPEAKASGQKVKFTLPANDAAIIKITRD